MVPGTGIGRPEYKLIKNGLTGTGALVYDELNEI